MNFESSEFVNLKKQIKIYSILNVFSKENSKNHFNAKIYCFFDSNGLLIYWYIKFLAGTSLDLKTTTRWFKDKTTTFKCREKLFSLIGSSLKQEPRENKNDKNILFLNNQELAALNYYVNFDYKGTFNNLIGVLKGNNPTGSYEKPNSSEVKSSYENLKNNPLMYLDIIKDNWYYNSFKNFIANEDDFNNLLSSLKKENENDFINYFKNSGNNSFLPIQDLIHTIEYENKTKGLNDDETREEFRNKIQRVKKSLETLFKIQNEIENQISRTRSKVQKIPTESIQSFNLEENTIIERAHIYPVYKIRERIRNEIEKWFSKNIIDLRDKFKRDALMMISDVNNLLNLSPDIHKIYDKQNLIYWDTSGKLCFIRKDKISNDSQEKLSKSFNQIRNLTPEMKKYLQMYFDEIASTYIHKKD
ncbi:MAG4270 family putative restriction endonuclease [Mycoplasma sp. 1232]|uniref:MAG4270 family putative restriction endonuclease n=1 Tax=Mycoplasma sp. 1232 TaxID=3108527 RepID=UPI002B25AF26|nr:HNH endonuclease [Mycoplasma sp. 1232]MEA4333653.1 HNH endonuclease [Mycoplasma sp. 1232]